MLSSIQQLLLTACRQRDPAAYLRGELQRPDCSLDAAARVLLQPLADDADDGRLADGMRVTRLLVDKLRLERLLRGSPPCAAAFAADMPPFVARFRRYCEQVPPTAVFPSEEAAAFAAFAAAGG